jgi:hypothetical protein
LGGQSRELGGLGGVISWSLRSLVQSLIGNVVHCFMSTLSISSISHLKRPPTLLFSPFLGPSSSICFLFFLHLTTKRKKSSLTLLVYLLYLVSSVLFIALQRKQIDLNSDILLCSLVAFLSLLIGLHTTRARVNILFFFSLLIDPRP